MSNCVSKPISALSWATSPLTGEEILPVVQNGENKIIQIKDLACKGGHGGGACIAELKCEIDFIKELAKKAMQIADSAFKTACANDAKLAALEQIVNQHDTLICEIQRNIQNILNRLEALKDDLKVSISVTESSPNKNYVFNQGNDYVGTVFVPMVTSDLVETNGGMAADAAAVARKLPKKLSDLVNDLRFITFIEGKFNENDTQYNGSAARTIHIPVRTSQLINDGDQNGNNFLIGLKDYAGNDVPVSGGIADLSRNDLPVATANKLGAVKLGSDSRTAEGAPLKLNNQNQGMIAPAAADSYGTVKVGGTADATQKKFPVTLDGNGNAIVNLSTLPTGTEELNDLSDVQVPNPQSGDILYYDGTKWINQSLKDLVESIIDCEYIQECISNFKVTPATHNKTATQTTAEYTVEATGAWTVAKESDPSNFITNFTTSGNDNGTITVTFGNNATQNTRTAKFIVTETATGRTARITINQSGVTPTVDRTITYNISGGQTNSIKVNNEAVSNGGQKTAPDGSNYTASIVSNDPGYKISSVTPSVGTYNTGTGTLTINPITADATVQVVLEQIPAETHKLTYVIPNHDDKIDIVPGDVYIPDGVAYTEDLAGAINDPEYKVTGVNIQPSSNGTYINGELTISDTVTTDTVVTINIASISLSVNPDDITVPQGQTTNTSITVTTTCTGGEYNARNLPTGITAVKQAGGFEVTVQSSVSIGQYQFEVYDECGNTATVTINVEEITPYFDENTNNCAYFSPRGVPVDAIDYDHDHIEHLNHARDGFINGNVYNNGIVTYIDSSDQSWNMTIPYSSPNGINDLQVYYLNEYITDGYGTSSPAVHTTYLDGAQATAANVSLKDNQNGTITVKMQLTSTVPTDLVTSGYGPVNIQDFGSGDRSMAYSSRKVGFAVKVLPTNPEYNKYPVVGSGPSAYHYILSTTIYQDNYLYDDINNQSVNVSTGGSTDTLFRVPYVLPITAFGFTTQSGTSSWIKDIVYPQTISGTGYYYGKFNSDAGPAEVGELQYQFSWTGGSAGSINKVVEVNRQ